MHDPVVLWHTQIKRERSGMKRKVKLTGISAFFVLSFATVYLFGLYDGRAGSESFFVKEVVAAENWIDESASKPKPSSSSCVG